MRKVLFTEAQLRRIIGEDVDGYLDLMPAKDVPDNAAGYQVFSNPENIGADDDNAKSVDTDNISLKKVPGRVPFRRWGGAFLGEEVMDDMDVRKSGPIAKQKIANAAAAGGKMANNMNSEKKATLGTLYKRKHDLENNPNSLAMNGKAVKKEIDAEIRRAQNTGKAQRSADKNLKSITNSPLTQVPNAKKGTGKGHHSGEETENGTIYYY